MIFPYLFLILALQDNSGEIAAQRAQIDRLQQEVQTITAELNRTRALLESEIRPYCSSQSRFETNSVRITDRATPIRANLFAMISTPAEHCLPADIRITATYFDAAGVFLCSGTVSVTQSAQIQNTSVEIRPYDSEVFLKWWDGPTLKQQTLVCRDFKGDEVRSPTDQAVSLRLYATAFPKRGGLSTSEMQINLPTFVRQ